MARTVHGLLPIKGMAAGPLGTGVALLLVAAAVFVVASLVSLFLCTSHHQQYWKTKSEKKGRLPTTSPPPVSPPQAAVASAAAMAKGDKKLVSISLSGIGSRALEVAKMMSWKKREEEDQDVLWKKTILMGEKCQPLNFSGRITYDSKGKQVHGFPIEDDN